MKTKMLAQTYDDPPKKHKSTYFEMLENALVRKHGPVKGAKLANRWWVIKDKTDPQFEEERTRITYGLA